MAGRSLRPGVPLAVTVVLLALVGVTWATRPAGDQALATTADPATPATSASNDSNDSSEPGGPAGTGAGPAHLTGAAATTTSPRAPFDALPVGAAPRTVPYGIGARLFAGGRAVDLTARFSTAFPGSVATGHQFTTVVGTGATTWVQLTAPGADLVHAVGAVTASGYRPFHTSTGRGSALAVTSGGLVVMPENGTAYLPAGGYFGAFTGSEGVDCGSCAASAAGPRIVLDQWSTVPGSPSRQGTWLWYPPTGVQALPAGTRSAGRLGTGWLAVPDGAGCWRIAPGARPAGTGPRLCSTTTPLVNATGTAAILVQDGRQVAVSPTTGQVLSTASMGAVTGWALPRADSPTAGARYVVPAAWESADAYLATARWDGALAVVRCSVRTGACTRAVRAGVRPGVDRIVLERGVADAG